MRIYRCNKLSGLAITFCFLYERFNVADELFSLMVLMQFFTVLLLIQASTLSEGRDGGSRLQIIFHIFEIFFSLQNSSIIDLIIHYIRLSVIAQLGLSIHSPRCHLFHGFKVSSVCFDPFWSVMTHNFVEIAVIVHIVHLLVHTFNQLHMLADKFLIQLQVQGTIHAAEVSSHDDVEIYQKTITPDQVPPNRKNNIGK